MVPHSAGDLRVSGDLRGDHGVPVLETVLPWLTLLVCLIVTVAVWVQELESEDFRAQAAFDREISLIERAVIDRLGTYEQLLRAGRGVASHSAVTLRGEWESFVESLDMQANYPGIDGFGFVVHVPHAERDAFEAAQRADRPNFTIFPPGDREDYFVNLYVEPAASASRAVGFDAGSRADRRAALERARDTGQPATTEKISLLSQGRASGDFLMYLAAYRGGHIPPTVEERRAALLGWVAGAFGIRGVMQGIADRHSTIDIDLFDGPDPADGTLLFDSDPHQPWSEAAAGAPRFTHLGMIETGGRIWALSLRSGPEFENAVISRRPEIIFSAGIALSLLLTTVVALLVRGRAHAHAMARTMTAALRAGEARYRRIIDTTSEGYWEIDAEVRTTAVNGALCHLLGYTPDEMLGRMPGEFMDIPDREVFAAQMAKRASIAHRSYEITLVKKTGTRIPARFNATSWTDESGKITGSFALITDITAQKRLERELLSDQERLHQILDAVPFAMVITRPVSGKILYVNQHAADLFGAAVGKVNSQLAMDFWENPAERTHFIETIWKEGRIESFEVRLKRRDGTLWWGILSAQLFAYEGDSALLVGCQDTTRLKQTETALRQAHQRLVDIGARIPGAIFQLTEDPARGIRCTFVSSSIERLTGIAAEAILADGTLLPGRIIDKDVDGFWDSMNAATRARESWSHDYRIETPDGRKWLRARSEPDLRTDGRVVWNGVMEDITERKRIEDDLLAGERRYRGLVETQMDMVVRLDPEGRFTFVNDTVCRRLGRSREDLIGRSWTPVVHPDDVAGTKAALEATLIPPAYRATVENRMLTGDGPTWFAWEGYAILDAAGGLIEVQAVGRDITEHKHQEHALREAHATAEEANQAKSRFLATMSHELRTPLNSILGFSELIRDQMFGEVGNQQYVDYAGYIYVSGRHLLDLINDILDLSKIEAGKMEIEPALLCPHHVINSTLVLVRERALRNGLTLEIALPAHLPQLWADERSLKQIIFNLVSNAIKFTPHGGRVTISAAATEEGGVEIAVDDTGIGIAADQIERILKPFEQADNRYGRSRGGTGLGLSLVQGLVALHGGRLDIRSTAGAGTTFTVWLPPRPPA